MNHSCFCQLILFLALLAAPVRAQEQVDFARQLEALMTGINQADVEQRRDAEQTWEKTCLAAGVPSRETDRKQICAAMIGQLGDSTAAHGQVFLLQQLGRIGRSESVKPVAQLMLSEDANVRDAAVRALAMNPDPAASETLLAELKKTRDAQTGLLLIKALGYRGDPAVVEVLVGYCQGNSKPQRDAALKALAKIRTPAAEAAIGQFFGADFQVAEREPFAEAYMVVADRYAVAGKTREAAEMYRKLDQETFKGSIRIAIAQGRLQTCVALDESAGELLEQYLSGDDPRTQQVAAGFVRQLDDEWIGKLARRIGRYPVPAQIALLRALGPHRNRAALPGVVAAVDSDNESVRIAALNALAGLADDNTVPLLVDQMLAGGATGEAAASSLEKVFASGVDQRVVELMKASKDVERRKRFLQILDRRRATSTIDAVIEEAGHHDGSVRQLAVQIFSRLGAASDIAALTEVWSRTEDRGERDEMEKAIVNVCRRIPDRDAQGEPVLAIYRKAKPGMQTQMLPLLGRIGGDKVLQLVREEMKRGTSDQRFEANVQALANWPDATVTDDLMRVSTHSDPGVRIRSVRALARIVVLPDARTDQQRLALLLETMKKAERDEERDLILDRAKAIRQLETLRFVVPYLEQEPLRQRACQTIVELAHHRGLREPNQAEFDRALARVIELSSDPKLVQRARGYMKK